MNKNSRVFDVIDLSGYSFSGKSAVYDLLSEFKGFFSQSKEFEFELIRIQGGILDLKNALVDNWSPIRSSEAIRNFYRLIRTIGGPRGYFTRFTTSGAQYDKFFPKFTEASNLYIDSLLEARWQCEWPFSIYNLDPISLPLIKIYKKFGFNKKETVYLSRISNENFINKTKVYLKTIFSNAMNIDSKAIILNNAFEPFCPEKSIILIDSAKSIIVDRDPRDVYISALNAGKIDNMQVGEAVIGGSVNNFIKRFKIYHAFSSDNTNRIYRLNFESLVLNYEVELNRIKLFLGEDICVHERKRSIFNPDFSVKNVGQWRNLKNQKLIKDIKLIEKELYKFCIDID
jgi:hypothetical protein